MATTQTREIESVRNKIRALLAKTVSAGCTEAEALSAAERAGALMEQYAVNVSELEIHEAVCITETIDGGVTRSPIFTALSSIARFCDCKCWITNVTEPSGRNRTRKHMYYNFFGFEDDVKMAVYLFRTIEWAMKTEVETFKQTDEYKRAYSARGASSSFLHGMAGRIGKRLDEMHKTRVIDIDAARANIEPTSPTPAPVAKSTKFSTSTSIMIIKDETVEDRFKGLGLNLKSVRRPAAKLKNARAYHRGVEAGDRVNLSRPLTGAASRRVSNA